MITAARAT